MERSYVMIKPGFANYDWVVKEVRNRLERVGLSIVCSGYVRYTTGDAKQHYAEHIAKSFYPELEAYIVSDKAFGMVVEGENAIKVVRYLVNGPEKAPCMGSIRYDIPKMLGQELDITKNVIHASDKPESAEFEEKLFRTLLSREQTPKTVCCEF